MMNFVASSEDTRVCKVLPFRTTCRAQRSFSYQDQLPRTSCLFLSVLRHATALFLSVVRHVTALFLSALRHATTALFLSRCASCYCPVSVLLCVMLMHCFCPPCVMLLYCFSPPCVMLLPCFCPSCVMLLPCFCPPCVMLLHCFCPSVLSKVFSSQKPFRRTHRPEMRARARVCVCVLSLIHI